MSSALLDQRFRLATMLAGVTNPDLWFYATRYKSQAPPSGDRRSSHNRPAVFLSIETRSYGGEAIPQLNSKSA